MDYRTEYCSRRWIYGQIENIAFKTYFDMEKEIIDVIEDEKEDISNDDLFNITSWGADPSVRELIEQYKEGDIEKPELQRKYVWDKKKASRFIESLLLGLPVPSIFLANTLDEKKLIIDGFQRLNTLYDFIETKIWSGDRSEFRLVDTTLINERWRGKSYNELDKADQRRLRNSTIHAIVFEQKHPQNDSGLFQVFERINTGGMTLNDQEIRNCVYQGKMNSLLVELNKIPEWKSYFDGKDDSRMKDMELILRFLAMNDESVYLATVKNLSLKKLLNDYMQTNVKADDQYIEDKRQEFVNVITFINEHLGEEAFFNYQNDLDKIRKRLYPTIYDSIMIATSIALRRNPEMVYEDLKDRRVRLVKDPEYRKSITNGTMQIENIRNRIAVALKTLYDLDL